MREIKFRVWNNKDKQYIKDISNFWIRPDFAYCFMGWREDYDGETVFEHKMEDIIYQQFTGLLDKNKKEIYEGDIVRFREIYSVSIHEDKIWHTGIVKYNPPKFYIDGNRPQFEDSIDTEVIGNIFENPDLLKT